MSLQDITLLPKSPPVCFPFTPSVVLPPSADFQTVWAACRAVIFGCIVIAVGLAMTILGYFDKHFSEVLCPFSSHFMPFQRITVMNGVESVYHDKVIQIQLKSMQVGDLGKGTATHFSIWDPC